MKKLKVSVYLATLFLLSLAAYGQTSPVVGTISSSASSCSQSSGSSTACIFLQVPNSVSTAGISIQGTFTATLQFEGTVDGSTWSSLNVTPVPSGTAVTSATAAGQWTAAVAGLQYIRVRGSAYTSGGALVTINPSQAPVASAAAGGGAVSSCSAAGNAYYASAGNILSCDTGFVDGGNGTISLGFTGTASGVVNLLGSASGTFALSVNATAANLTFGGSTEFADTQGIIWSQTTGQAGTGGMKMSVAGTGTTEALDITAGTSTGLLNTGNRCNVNSNVALSASAANVCSWTLPNVAKVWGWQCTWVWNLTTLGTTPTLTVGMNAAQAPTSPGEVGSASIYTSNAGASTQANGVAFTTTGNNNILTSGSPAGTGSYRVETSGTINASATSGTFALTATLGGTGPAGNIGAGSTCILY